LDQNHIFTGLLTQPSFYRKVIAYLDEDFFDDTEALVLRKIKDYAAEFKKQATPADVRILLQSDMDITEGETQAAIEYVNNVKNLEKIDDDLLFKETENFCKERAFENVLRKGTILMVEGEQKDGVTKGMLPELFRKALSLSFVTSLGHDYFRDAPERYKHYTSEEEILSSTIPTVDKALGGGYRRKSLYMFLGRTNIGKTLWLCDQAVSLMKSGLNVLYVTGEMAEELIGQRLDANILNYEMGELGLELGKKEYLSRVRDLYSKTAGRLKIKEYSPGACNALSLQTLIQEYKLKEDFMPDVIILDYINLFGSFRLPAHAMSNTYLYTRTVTEEMRGLAREIGAVMISATQTNRDGAEQGENTGMGDTADSYGLPMTVDWMGAIIQNDELFRMMKYLLKCIKSRFGDNINSVYTVGVDRSHMKLYELPEEEHELPQNIKDHLAYQAAMAKAQKNNEAIEDLTLNFDEE
jgi:replicative DNA helicase